VLRPRIVAVASAVAASLVAFLVVSRWRLAGTLAGAALIPFVYVLVSHWSFQGLDRTARWLRPRISRGGRVKEPRRPPAAESAPVVASQNESPASSGTVVTKYQVPKRGARRTQWLPVGFASLALAVSVYALASLSPGERVIVRDRIVQEIVTVTTPTEKPNPAASGGGAPSTADPGQTVQPGEPSSTTIAPATTTTSPTLSATTSSLTPSSTTTALPSTTTSLP
jgi:hypothetical protein